MTDQPGPVTALDAWLYGTPTARLRRRADGRITWQWSRQAVERWGFGSQVVSALLPIGGDDPHPLRVRAFLSGYLPEGRSRTHHAVEAGVDVDDVFGLIRAYGRDLAGALIFVPVGTSVEPADPRYVPIDLHNVEQRLLKATTGTGRLDAPDSFSSLPGMVPKVLLHREGEQWYACRGGAPSTWIVKRNHDADGPAHDVVDTEVLALGCARRLGLGSVRGEVLQLSGIRAIAVERYDRFVTAGDRAIGRRHQEDLAQALGIDTGDANRKFQRPGSLLPSLREAARILNAGGSDVDDLLRLVTFNFALGNTDLHAKNISFLHGSDGRTSLAPVYDVSLHLHSSGNNGQFAVLINGKGRFDDLTPADLVAEGRSWGLPASRADRAVRATLSDLSDALGAERATGAHKGVDDGAWNHALARVASLREQASSTAT